MGMKKLRKLQKMFKHLVKEKKEHKKDDRDLCKWFNIDDYHDKDVVENYLYIKNMDDYYDKHIEWKKLIDYDSSCSFSISNTGVIWNDTLNIPACKYTGRYVRVKGHASGVHRLVALYFIPVPQRYFDMGLTIDDLQVNHIDGIKPHNYVYNLEWCTAKENMQHAVKHGLIKYSMEERSHLATISTKKAIEICEKLQKGIPVRDIAKEMQVDVRLIRHIKCRECWKSISEKYTFPYERNVKPGQITDDQIHSACKLISEGKLKNTEIGKIVGISRRTVNRLRLRQTRNDITSQYKY